jgi:hypothetical protein
MDIFTSKLLMAQMLREMKNLARGFTYTLLDSPDEHQWLFRCDQCLVVSDLEVNPFPHLPNCPMKSEHDRPN